MKEDSKLHTELFVLFPRHELHRRELLNFFIDKLLRIIPKVGVTQKHRRAVRLYRAYNEVFLTNICIPYFTYARIQYFSKICMCLICHDSTVQNLC